jgi:hypothetical protein
MTVVHDNECNSRDRYTVVIQRGDHCDFYGMDSAPMSLDGFNQFYGSDIDGYIMSPHLGKIVDIGTLPDQVKEAIKQREDGFLTITRMSGGSV